MTLAYTPIPSITTDRLARFDAFRASLPLPERRMLDAKLARWIGIMAKRRPACGFGIKCAQELYMALMESECELY
jgi:hypothetical protein